MCLFRLTGSLLTLVESTLPLPCELTQGWKTAKDILQDACKTIGAELRNEDSLMTVTLSDQKFSEIHQEITDLEEFGSSNQATLRLLSSLLNLETKTEHWVSPMATGKNSN